jgi:hypothetical protein
MGVFYHWGGKKSITDRIIGAVLRLADRRKVAHIGILPVVYSFFRKTSVKNTTCHFLLI